MRKDWALLSSLVMVVCGVRGQGSSMQPTAIRDNAALHGQSKTPFPSSPEFRSKAKIHLVRHGCLGGCSQYSVTVYGNGKVIYEGREEVRFKGRARGKLSKKAVDDLMLKINEMDFWGYRPQPGTGCVTDGPTATITVSEPGR